MGGVQWPPQGSERRPDLADPNCETEAVGYLAARNKRSRPSPGKASYSARRSRLSLFGMAIKPSLLAASTALHTSKATIHEYRWIGGISRVRYARSAFSFRWGAAIAGRTD
jgi:hypothetical protein